MPSARDNCFKKSVDKLKDNGKLQKLNVQHQQRWIRDGGTGVWSQTNEIWYKVIRAVSWARKALGRGAALDPGTTDGTRIPDMTLTPEGGDPVVVDNKFDGDDWNAGQKEDYNTINEQQNGNPKAKDLQLNSQVCKCGDEGATDPVPVDAPDPLMVPGCDPVSPDLSPLKDMPGIRAPEMPLGDPILMPG